MSMENAAMLGVPAKRRPGTDMGAEKSASQILLVLSYRNKEDVVDEVGAQEVGNKTKVGGYRHGAKDSKKRKTEEDRASQGVTEV